MENNVSKDIIVVSDSIPKKLNSSDVTNIEELSNCNVNFHPFAFHESEATEFIQNHSKYDSPIIIHTGTNSSVDWFARATAHFRSFLRSYFLWGSTSCGPDMGSRDLY